MSRLRDIFDWVLLGSTRNTIPPDSPFHPDQPRRVTAEGVTPPRFTKINTRTGEVDFHDRRERANGNAAKG